MMLLWWVACGSNDGEAPGDTSETPLATDRAPYVGCTYDLSRSGSDGEVTETEHVEYDDHGWSILREVRSDLVDDVLYTSVNDVFGNQLEFVVDVGIDGVVDESSHGSYDADGNPVRVEFDDDGDQTVDRVETYAASGGLVRSGEVDFDADGVPESALDYGYDADGRRIERNQIDIASQRLQYAWRYTWHRDTDLPATQTTRTYDNREKVIFEQESGWEYDGQDRAVRAYADNGDFGLIVEDYVYEGDAPRPASAHQVETRDGYADVEIDSTWTYDSEWRLLEHVETSSVGTERETLVWDCPETG